MTPVLWLVFALVAIASALLIATAILTAPRNDKSDR